MASVLGLLLLQAVSAQAQSRVLSAGGSVATNAGSLSYSVGQIDYAAASVDGKGSVSLGVQQPYSVTSITGIKGTEKLCIDCSVYPNPSSDFVVLNWVGTDAQTLNYKITDITGKTVLAQATAEIKGQIDLKSFSVGIYIISVADSKNNFLKSFRLVKN